MQPVALSKELNSIAIWGFIVLKLIFFSKRQRISATGLKHGVMRDIPLPQRTVIGKEQLNNLRSLLRQRHQRVIRPVAEHGGDHIKDKTRPVPHAHLLHPLSERLFCRPTC